MALSKLEQKRLKGLAHSLRAVAQAGKSGLSEEFIQSVDQALTARELIKVKFLENAYLDKKEDSKKLAHILNAELVAVIGFTVVLYRYNDDLKKHVLDTDEE